MRKRLCLVLAAVLLLLLIPHAASANSPVRSPWLLEIECSNMVPGTTMDVLLFAGSERTRTLEDAYHSYSDGTSGGLSVWYEDGETAFCLQVTTPDGTQMQTDAVGIVEYGKYAYDGATNRLEANGTYYSRAENCTAGAEILLYLIFLLFAPLGLTLLIEFLTSLCFGIRPRKYVVVINLITNPAMNLLLLLLMFLFSPVRWVYWVALGIMELAAVGIEYLFYTKKCRQIGRLRLFLFTLTANVLSFLIGCGLLYFLT